MDDEYKGFPLGLSTNFGDHYAKQQYYNSLPAEVLKNIAERCYQNSQNENFYYNKK